MAYCGPRGLPLSVFLTTWSPEDQEAALEWSAYEARRHPVCGTHPEDFADPMNPDVHFHPAVCVGCQRRESAEAQLSGRAGQHAGAEYRCGCGRSPVVPDV